MQTRRLSSGSTFLAKFIVAPIFTLMGLIVLALMLGSARRLPAVPGIVGGVVVMAWLALMGLFVWRTSIWKRVWLSTSGLRISNYFKEIQVPLDQIAAVSEQRWGPRTVTIRLRQPTAFGDAVRFNPRPTPWLWRAHPMVAELQKIASGAGVTAADLEHGIGADRRRLFVTIGLVLCGIAALMALVESLLRQSDAYAMGLKALTESPAVVEALGAPATPGLWVNGNLSQDGSMGCAALSFALNGSRQHGTAHVNAIKSAGAWRLTRAWVEMPSGSRTVEVVNDQAAAADNRCPES